MDRLSSPALTLTAARLASSLYLDVDVEGRLLVAVGERGLVVRSSDEGRSWTQAKVPVSTTLTSVSAAPGGAWWVVGHGGVLLRSDDGGQVWTKRLDETALNALLGDEVRDPEAVAAGLRGAPTGVDTPLLAVRFFSTMHGMAVGAYGVAISTDDGGRTWKAVQRRMTNPRALHLYSVAGDGKSIYIVGERGLVRRSDDGGLSFKLVPTPYEGTYFKVVTLGQRVCVLGMRGNAYWSDDLGTTWQRCPLRTQASISGAFVDGANGLFVVDEAGQVHVSGDGGQSFSHPVPAMHSPLTAVARAFDGALVIAGVRGLTRVELPKP